MTKATNDWNVRVLTFCVPAVKQKTKKTITKSTRKQEKCKRQKSFFRSSFSFLFIVCDVLFFFQHWNFYFSSRCSNGMSHEKWSAEKKWQTKRQNSKRNEWSERTKKEKDVRSLLSSTADREIDKYFDNFFILTLNVFASMRKHTNLTDCQWMKSWEWKKRLSIVRLC